MEEKTKLTFDSTIEITTKYNIMMTYFSTQIRTNKNRKELSQSLYGLLREKENDYFPVYPFCFFDSEYYKNINKRRKSPYYGEIKNDEFVFTKMIYINYFRQMTIAGKINYENNLTSIRLRFKMNIITTIGYVALIIFGIWGYISKGESVFLFVLPIFLTIEYFIVLYSYMRIRKAITKT